MEPHLNPTATALATLKTRFASPEEALAVLDELEAKRAEDYFIRYWKPYKYEEPCFQAWSGGVVKQLVVTGGNRSGKTITGAATVTAWALGKEFFIDEPAWSWVEDLPIPDHDVNIWIVGLDFNVVRDVIWREKLIDGKEIPGFVPRNPNLVRIVEHDKQIFFTLPSGRKAVITCKSADSGREKFQSASVDLVWIDEECDGDIYDECFQRTSDCGGKILVTLTPLVDISSGVREPWVYKLYEAMRQGDHSIAFTKLSVLDNPKISTEEKQRLLDKWSGHVEERARLYGDFIRRSGLVFPMWSRKTHLVKSVSVQSGWMRVVSIDPAATGITAALWGAIDPRGNIFIYREYYDRDQVVSDHAKSIMVRNAGDKIDIWLIDPKWGSQRNPQDHKTGAQLYKDAGIPVRLAEVDEDFGLNSAREYLQSTTEPTNKNPKAYIVGDQCPNFCDEIEHYVYATFQRGELKGLTKEKPIKRADHLMDAFRYMCAGKFKPRFRVVENSTEDEQRREAALNSYS